MESVGVDGIICNLTVTTYDTNIPLLVQIQHRKLFYFIMTFDLNIIQQT